MDPGPGEPTSLFNGLASNLCVFQQKSQVEVLTFDWPAQLGWELQRWNETYDFLETEGILLPGQVYSGMSLRCQGAGF